MASVWLAHKKISIGSCAWAGASLDAGWADAGAGVLGLAAPMVGSWFMSVSFLVMYNPLIVADCSRGWLRQVGLTDWWVDMLVIQLAAFIATERQNIHIALLGSLIDTTHHNHIKLLVGIQHQWRIWVFR